MSGIKTVNNNSEVANRDQALAINMSAARSIQGLMRTNLGPRGTLKILVGGAGDLRITKDGNVLLHDMVSVFFKIFLLVILCKKNDLK